MLSSRRSRCQPSAEGSVQPPGPVGVLEAGRRFTVATASDTVPAHAVLGPATFEVDGEPDRAPSAAERARAPRNGCCRQASAQQDRSFVDDLAHAQQDPATLPDYRHLSSSAQAVMSQAEARSTAPSPCRTARGRPRPPAGPAPGRPRRLRPGRGQPDRRAGRRRRRRLPVRSSVPRSPGVPARRRRSLRRARRDVVRSGSARAKGPPAPGGGSCTGSTPATARVGSSIHSLCETSRNTVATNRAPGSGVLRSPVSILGESVSPSRDTTTSTGSALDQVSRSAHDEGHRDVLAFGAALRQREHLAAEVHADDGTRRGDGTRQPAA